MPEAIRDSLVLPASTSQDLLTGILRQGAQRMLAQAKGTVCCARRLQFRLCDQVTNSVVNAIYGNGSRI